MAPRLETLSLERALEKPGCPICLLVQEAEEKWLWIFFWERVNDVGVREDILKGGGFCQAHSWRLLRFERARWHTGMGTAILCEGLLTYWATLLERRRNELRSIKGSLPGLRRKRASHLHPRSCLLCSSLMEVAGSGLWGLVRELPDQDFRRRYLAGDGLCLPHLDQALSISKDASTSRFLVERALERLAALVEQLKDYVRSFDYQARDVPGWSPIRSGEACRRALAVLAGEEVGL